VDYFEWSCTDCGYVEQTVASELLRRLQQVGAMKRAEEPDLDIALELARSATVRFTCPRCKRGSLIPARASETEDDDWGDPKPCVACGKPIPAERVAFFPEVERCSACQTRVDNGGQLSGDDYCPHCGTPMVMRKTSGGITRYEQRCPQCRR